MSCQPLMDQAGHRKYLNGSERKSFFKVSRMLNQQERLFCQVMYYTGCRISEALSLKKSSLDYEEKLLIIPTLKRRDSSVFRQFPLPDCLLFSLENLTKEIELKEHMWNYSRSTAYRLIKRVMKEASVSGTQACPKGLRHGFAIACVQANVPITMIQKWMGHASLETTSIYLSVSGQEERQFASRIW